MILDTFYKMNNRESKPVISAFVNLPPIFKNERENSNSRLFEL